MIIHVKELQRALKSVACCQPQESTRKIPLGLHRSSTTTASEFPEKVPCEFPELFKRLSV
jgi:hypothetical protein